MVCRPKKFYLTTVFHLIIDKQHLVGAIINRPLSPFVAALRAAAGG